MKLKQRSPFVQHLINRSGSGVHVKSKKAVRRRDKVRFKRDQRDGQE